MRTQYGVEEIFVQQTAAEDHAIRIQSPRIISDALELDDGKLRDLTSLADAENQVETIYEGLTVEPIQDGSEVLTLQYRGTNPEDCQFVLDNLMFAYRNFLDDGQTNIGREMQDWIMEAKDDIQEKLDEVNLKYDKFKEQHTELFLLGEEGATLAQQRLISLEQKVQEEEARLREVDNRLFVINSGQERGEDPQALVLIAEASVLGNAKSDDYADRLLQAERLRIQGQRELRSVDRVIPLRMQLQNLMTRFGADHPDVKALIEQIVIAEEVHEEDAQGLSNFKVNQDSRAMADERLQILTKSLQNEKARIQLQLSQLKKEFKTAKDRATVLAKDFAKNRSHIEEVDRLKSLYEATVQRVADVDLLASAGGDSKVDLQTLQQAAPGLRVAPSLAKSLAAGTMLGFLAGFGLGYLVEMFDKTFRSPQEVSKILQLPMIGHIPEITCQKPEESALADVLVTAHKPKSPLAENFRAIRTALYFSTQGQQNHVIQTTSPVPGDGKSTLTANIAVTIAQSNKTVLLIDADFRRPTQHKLFGVANDVGLSSVVTEQVEPDGGVHATEVPNLYVMGSGPRPHNPSELLTSPQFADLVEVIREQYDFVLIDTPPVLAVTDPGIVSARVDGVIMCLRIRKNGRPSAVRARKVLHDLDANMLGIVVNGIDHRSGSYGYYSSYRRGYGYNYAYKYGYGYGMDKTEKAINKYFQEPKPDQTATTQEPTAK